jgi:hypothetical protein
MKLTDPLATMVVGVLGVLIAAGTYFLTERSKLEAESYARRSERYERLVESASSFHVGAADLRPRAVFLREMDQCWLHCPDHVLRAGYRFIDSVKTGANSTGEDRAKAFSEFMVAIREDLISGSRVTQSSMRADEYQVIKLNLQVPQ